MDSQIASKFQCKTNGAETNSAQLGLAPKPGQATIPSPSAFAALGLGLGRGVCLRVGLGLGLCPLGRARYSLGAKEAHPIFASRAAPIFIVYTYPYARVISWAPKRRTLYLKAAQRRF